MKRSSNRCFWMILAVHQYMLHALQGNDFSIKQSDGPRHLARFYFMREIPARVAINGRVNGQIFAGVARCRSPAYLYQVKVTEA